MYNGMNCRRHPKPPKKTNILSIVLIVIGTLLVFFYTPPWVWCFLLGLGLIVAGIITLKKWR